MRIPKPRFPSVLKRTEADRSRQRRQPSPAYAQPEENSSKRISPYTLLPSPTRPIPHSLPASALFTPQAMQRAWRAVRAAGGGAGVDGITLQAFSAHLDEELEILRQSLIQGSYRPRQLRQVYVPKKQNGLRPLVIWTLRDRIAQRVVYDLIAPAFDAIFFPVSFGFRTGLGTADAVAQITTYRDQGLRWVVDADIKSCFEEIDIRRLGKLLRKRIHHPRLRQLVQVWLKAGVLGAGKEKHGGIPQGSVLSPLFANIYLHEFDRQLVKKHLALVRYADDFIICTRRKNQAQVALAEAERALKSLRLASHPQKTRIVHFDQGFKFLGYFFVKNQVYRL